MNWTHVLRIAWKDYRRMGAFWLALVAFWLVCLGFVTWTSFQTHNFVAPLTVESAILLMLITATVYALGWGAITFAAEHEDNTYDMLRSLPVNAKSVFYGKLFFGVNSTVLLVVTLLILWLVHAMVLRSQGGRYEFGLADVESLGFSLTGMMIPLSMLIGIFWSLRIKRPLLALGLTGGTVAITPFVCIVVAAMFYPENVRLASELSQIPALPICVTLGVATVFLFVIDRKLVTHWLPTYQSELDTPAAILPDAAVPNRNTSGFGRLLWLHRKQDLGTCVAFGAVGLLLWALSGDSFGPFLATTLVFLCGILGVLTFRADQQQHRFRLLAQLGVRPFPYWMSRLLRPALAVLVLSLCVAGMATAENLFSKYEIEHWKSSAFLFLLCLAVFSIGQFCSLAFRSTIIAVAATLIASIAAWGWLWLCTVLHVPLWLGFAPVVLLPLLASYLRIPRWFRETGSWKQWIAPVIPLLLLMVGVPFSTAMYRIYEIPGSEVPAALTASRQPTDQERAGAEAYRQVFRQLPSLDETGVPLTSAHIVAPFIHSAYLNAWAEEHSDIIDQLVTATQNPSDFPEEFRAKIDMGENRGVTIISVALLQIQAKHVEVEGEFDDAWKFYVAALNLARHQKDGDSGIAGAWRAFQIEVSVYSSLVPWAMLEGNSADRIENAAIFLDEYRRNHPAWNDTLRSDYALLNSYLDDPSGVYHRWLPPGDQLLVDLLPYAPWEKTRARRLLDYKISRVCAILDRVEHRQDPLETGETRIEAAAKSTFMGNISFQGTGSTFAHAERQRIGAIYQLAAIAHHKKHGEYPQDFSTLKIGDRALPDDFFSPGKKLQIERDVDSHVNAPFLLTNHSKDNATETFSDGATEDQHFLLPMFDDWNLDRFDRRNSEQTHKKSQTPVVTEARQAQDSMAMEFSRNSKLQFYRDLLSSLGHSQEALIALRQVIVDLLRGDGPDRVRLIRSLGRVREFIPEYVPLVLDTNPSVAGEAANAIRESILDLRTEPYEPIEGVDALLSKSASEHDVELVGIPILNHENGHYYEIMQFEDTNLDWESTLAMASRRRFKGMSGHLVTITSKQENDFLTQAFADSYRYSFFETWVGATDSEKEGVWKWACGPEAGTTLWDETQEEKANGYANWLGGTPTSSAFIFGGDGDETSDYLMWRVHTRDDEMWTAEQSHGSEMAIVEYSPDAVAEPPAHAEDSE